MTVELLVLAAPIIAMMVSRMLMGFIDFVMVSQLGTEAQAAISPASIFVFVVGVLGLGVAHAIQTYVAQADGRGESHLAGGYAWQAFYIATVFGLITIPVAATTELWFGWIARVGQHDATVTEMEVQYIRIALWSVAPSIVCIGLNAFFMGLQRPWITFVAVFVSLLANGVGNWLLIFGNLGFPRLGIVGAAYATVVAWFLRAIVLWAAMMLPAFDRRYNTRRSFAFSWHRLKGLIRVGAPTSVGWLVDLGSWTVFMTLTIPLFGKQAMAASNVVFQLMHLSFMPAIGIGIALCSQVGFSVGARQPEVARRRARVAFWMTGVYMGAVGLLFWLAGRPLVALPLFNASPAVVEVGTFVLLWAVVFQVFDAMAITYTNALRGAGDTRWPAAAMAVLCLGVFIIGGYAAARLAPGLWLDGPWAMCALYIVLYGLAVFWRWRCGRWEQIRLFDEKHPPPGPIETPEEVPIAVGTAELNGEVEEAEPAEPRPVPVTER